MPKDEQPLEEVDENVRALLTYSLWWITGIVLYLIEEKSDFVKFHALQSTITFLGITIAMWIVNGILFASRFAFYHLAWVINLVWLLSVILWLVLMVKAYQGERFKIPVIGDIAEGKVYGK